MSVIDEKQKVIAAIQMAIDNNTKIMEAAAKSAMPTETLNQQADADLEHDVTRHWKLHAPQKPLDSNTVEQKFVGDKDYKDFDFSLQQFLIENFATMLAGFNKHIIVSFFFFLHS